jgi:hypothetical protein
VPPFCVFGVFFLLGVFLRLFDTLPACGRVALRLTFSVMWLKPLLISADGSDGVFFALMLPVMFSFLPSLLKCLRFPRPILVTTLFIFIASTHAAHAMPFADDDNGAGDDGASAAGYATAITACADVCMRGSRSLAAAAFASPGTADGEDDAAEDAGEDMDWMAEHHNYAHAEAFGGDDDVEDISQEVFDEFRAKAAVSGKGTTMTYSYTVKVRSTCHVYLVLSVHRVRS